MVLLASAATIAGRSLSIARRSARRRPVDAGVVEHAAQHEEEGVHVVIAQAQRLMRLAHAAPLVLLGAVEDHREIGRAVLLEDVEVEVGEDRPEVEGTGGGAGFIDAGFVDPVQQWSTSEASPSGLGIVGETLVLASLRGQRLWLVDLVEPSESTAVYVGEYGRLRDALAGPDGSLWFLTNNTDGRGSPRAGDDHLYSVPLLPRDG